MWYQEYEQLNMTDKGEFRRLANNLLSRTFLLRDVYNDQVKMIDSNRDYRLAVRLFPILQGYLSLAGWDLYQDRDYGVIYLRNQFGSNHVRFNYFTTLFLYTLRLIYEEKREQIELYHEVRTDTVSVIQKMNALGLLPKGKAPAKDRLEAQKTLARYQILDKVDGGWDSDGNKLVIYPTILFILPNSELDHVVKMLEQLRKESASPESESPNTPQEVPSE